MLMLKAEVSGSSPDPFVMLAGCGISTFSRSKPGTACPKVQGPAENNNPVPMQSAARTLYPRLPQHPRSILDLGSIMDQETHLRIALLEPSSAYPAWTYSLR